MSRKISLALSLMLLVALATGAQAATGHWMISGFGGAAVPSGDFSDKDKLDAGSGYQFGGSVEYALNEMWAIGVDGSYNKNKDKSEGDSFADGSGGTITFDEAKFTTTQFGAHGKFMFPSKGAMGAYGLLGLGVYNTTRKLETTDTPVSGPVVKTSSEGKTDARFGGRVGLGTSYKINDMWGIGAEGDYNFINEDKAKTGGSSSLQYIGVHGVLTLHIMPK